MKITVEQTDIPVSQLEGGEEQWVPEPPDLEERDILKVTYTGNDV